MAEGRKGIAQVFSGLNALVGLWLVLAPWLLGYSMVVPAMWNDVLVGTAVLLMAGVRLLVPTRFQAVSRGNMLLGAWLIIAPFVLEYGQENMLETVNFWNDLLAGVAIIVLAWLSAETTRRRRTLGNK